MSKRPAGVRIFASPTVDHLSIEADEWEALCGQRVARGFRPAFDVKFDHVHLCRRCEALSAEETP